MLNASNSVFERTEKSFFFLPNHIHNQLLLTAYFGKKVTHFTIKHRNQFVQKWLPTLQKRIGITNRPAKDATNYITGCGIGRQLSIGNGKGNGADMVANYTKCDVALIVGCRIFFSGDVFNFPDNRLKYI